MALVGLCCIYCIIFAAHWVAVIAFRAGRRRTLAAAEVEEVERVALEQRLAEIQAEKEAAAKAAADAAAPSALYSELASLRLRPEDLEQLEQSEEEAPAEGNLQAAPGGEPVDAVMELWDVYG